MKIYTKLVDNKTNNLKEIKDISFNTDILINYKNKLNSYSNLSQDIKKYQKYIKFMFYL